MKGDFEDHGSFSKINDRLMSEVVRNYDKEKKEKKNFLESFSTRFDMTDMLEYYFIIVFAFLCTVFMYLVDLAIMNFRKLMPEIKHGEAYFSDIIFYVGFNVFFALLSVMPGHFISRNANGSGYVEIRNILSGIPIYRYLSPEALLAKTIAVVLSKTTCLCIGVLGPYIHLCGLIGYRIMKFPVFRPIFNDISKRNLLLAACSGCGITLSMGTPIGGIMFALEAGASGSIIKNVYKVAMTSFCVSLFMNFLGFSMYSEIIIKGSLPNLSIDSELISFLFAGFLCGVFGGLLPVFLARINQIRARGSVYFKNRYYYAAMSTTIIAIICYHIDFLRLGERPQLAALLTNKDFQEKKEMIPLAHPDEGVYLFFTMCAKYLLILLTVTVDIPAGLLGPCLVFGSLFGKFYCHLLSQQFSVSSETVYSIICSQAFFAGANQQITSAIMIFELTGQVTHVLPMFLASCLAFAVSRMFSSSFNAYFLEISHISHEEPHLSAQYYKQTVEDAMSSKLDFCIRTWEFRLINVIKLLFNLPKRFNYSIALINSKNRVDFTFPPRNVYRVTMDFIKKIGIEELALKQKILKIMAYLSHRFEGNFKLMRKLRKSYAKAMMTQEQLLAYDKEKIEKEQEMRAILTELETGHVLKRKPNTKFNIE